jgi:conjugal transfer ATP-binding protein TraC
VTIPSCKLNKLGLLWECTPLTFAGPKTLATREGLFRAGLPGGSVLQLVLHADTHIQPILDAYRVSRQVDEVLARTNTERIIDFFDQGRSGLILGANRK